MKNRFIENYQAIKKISEQKGVDMEVATLMWISDTDQTDWNEEKEAFDKAYALYWKNDFSGEIADYYKGE